MAFSLDDTSTDAEHEQGLSFDANTSPVPTGVAASQRAVKADYALGQSSPGIQALSTSILSGNENDLRQNVANEEALRWDAAKTQYVTKVASQMGGRLTPEDRDFMLALTREQYKTDASDILEKRFAEKYTDHTLDALGPNFEGVYQRIGQLMPETASNELDIYTGVLKSNEYEKTQLENLHSEWQNTGWLSAAPDYVGQLVPLLSNYRLHNVLAGAPTTNILPGENLGQQIAYLKSLPYDQRKTAYDAALKDLKGKNMLTALEFAQAVTSFNATDSFLSSAFGVADAGTLASGLMGGVSQLLTRGARKALQSGTDTAIGVLSQSAKSPYKPLSEAGKGALATAEDILKSPPNPALDKAALQEMQKEAGVRVPGQFVYIPEAAAKNLEAVEEGKGAITSFKAGDGKSPPVTVKLPDETLKYVPTEDADKVSIKKGEKARLIQYGDGTVAKSVQQADGQWSIPFDSQKVRLNDTPAIGHSAIELGDTEHKFGTTVHGYARNWGDIKSVETELKEPTFYTDRKNNVTVQTSKTPDEGMVPVEYDQFGGVKFHPTIKGTDYHIPEAAAKALGDNGGIEVVGGKPTFFTDLKNRVSVEPGAKGPGMVPVTVSRDGSYVKFHPTTPQEQALQDMRVAMKDGAKAAADTKLDPEATLTGIGAIPKAAEVGATRRIAGVADKDGAITDTLPSALNPTNFFGTGKALSREMANRIVDRMLDYNEKLNDILGRLHVPRGTLESVAAGVRETSAKLQREYGGRLNDGIIDFLHIPPEINPNKANLDSVVMRVGMPNGSTFTSRGQAEHYFSEVYGFLPGEATIEQKGGSFYIGIMKHVDETTQGWLDALVTPGNTTPVNMWNMMLNRFRSSEDLLAQVQRDNRHIATHAPQIMNKALKEQLASTESKLTRAERKEVGRMLEINRDADNPILRNPDGTPKRGMWYKDANEFEQEFINKFGKMPTADQVEHYFNYVRTSDFDWTIRNLAMFRDKGRLGIEQFAFKTGNGSSPWFEGKRLDSGIPWGGQDAAIWFQEAGKQGSLIYKHDMVNSTAGMTKAQMDKLINEQGYHVFQVAAPTKRPLADALGVDEQIHFVVTNGMDRKALNFQQLEYRPGGHSIYPDPWYVKQPVLQKGVGGRLHYYGDNAVMNFASEAQAKKYAKAFDDARIMLAQNDPRLPSFLAKNLPYNEDDFRKMFNSGHLSLEHPIVHTYTGATTFETDTRLKKLYDGYVDATKSEWNLDAMMDKSFQADRDGVLNSVNEKLFQITNSRQLDPYIALNKGLSQGIRNLWMGDSKIGSVQHWIEEFGDVMKPNFKTLNNNPMFFLYNPQFNEGVPDKARLAAAKASRLAIVNFLGVQSEIGTKITHLQNKLASSVYNTLGQGASEVFADHMLPAIRDPAKYARAVAFHTKLGMFNPIQAVVQAQSLAHVLAVAGPSNGLPSMAAAYFARRLAHNDTPAIVDAFAKKAAAFGYDENHFREMVGALRANGLYEVAGETAMRDDVMDPKLFNSTVGRWLDKGTMFFAEGERAVRLAAYATAHREWRLANPLATLDNRAMGKIMSRSDLLSVNMTRASAASWQQGLLSIPLQFMAFNARLMEQLLPGTSRLTTAEKLRAYGTYSALYGIPTAAAATTGIWPYYDDIKEAAMKRGIDTNSGATQAMMEGIPQFLLSLATGHQYNIAQRLGPNGSTLLRDAISGEKSPIQIAGGASASIIGDIWSSTDPLRRAIAGAFTGDSEHFPMKTTDWMNVLNNVSTVQLGSRIHGWAEYGKYVSKNGVQVGDMDSMDAAMSTLGLTPTHIADAYLKQKAGKEDLKDQKPYSDLALHNFAMAVQAGAQGDEQGFRDYMTRVTTYVKAANLNVEQQQKLYDRALKYRPDLQDKVNWDFVRNSPDSQYSARFNTFFSNPQVNK